APPAAALTGADVSYPVYIDPAITTGKQDWMEVDNQGGHDWNDNSQNAKVGLCDYQSCLSPYRTMRAYYQMDTGYLSAGNGSHASVYDAHFYITQVWNGANGCTATPVDLFSSGGITSSTTWPGPAISMLDRVYSGAGNGCSSASLSFNAINWATSAANGGWPNTTFALRADTESNDQQWKQFNNAATLSVTFNYGPGIPATPTMTGAVTCNGVNYTSSNTPQFSTWAVDNNPSPLHMNLNFQVRDLTNNLMSQGTASGVASGQGGGGSWTSGALPNAQFQVYANATDIPTDNAQPITSIWSASYYFTVLNENLQGISPKISSFDFPQDPYGNAQWGAPQGRGQFLIAGTSNANVVGYEYSFDSNFQNAPPVCGTTTPGSSVPAGNGGTAVVSVPSGTGLVFGHHRLYVRGFDMVGQPTNVTAYDFMVGLTVMPSTANLPATGAVHNPYLGKCLDDLNRTLGNLATVDLTGCNNSAAQVWSFKSDGSLQTGDQADGWWCLDVDNASTAISTPVHLHQCNGGGSQQWTVTNDGKGDWALLNPESGLCLDDPNASTSNGTGLQIYTCNGSPAQKWIVDVDSNRYEGQDAVTSVTTTNGSAPGIQGDVGGV
ncbi:hypothetical protein ABH920_010077, partial [Catenulispora sp. EB89]|uniref:ricin-type beta-trefoil lectin domain protein n=1 Tax=Catenulispora sp. EB89 TaxID=3156257 RepID=UPI00351603E5